MGSEMCIRDRLKMFFIKDDVVAVGDRLREAIEHVKDLIDNVVLY